MNPCPCGYLGHQSGKCCCTPDQIPHHRGRMSGPLLDRIDLQIEVQIMTLLLFLTFYIPCISTFAVMHKTIGRRDAGFAGGGAPVRGANLRAAALRAEAIPSRGAGEMVQVDEKTGKLAGAGSCRAETRPTMLANAPKGCVNITEKSASFGHARSIE
jgi:hypothetical protein